MASNRARAHENAPASDGPRGGQKFEEGRYEAARAAAAHGTGHGSSQTESTLPTEAIPLLPLGTPDNLEEMINMRTGMWYI